jgi:thioredoxin-related protein
MKKVAYICVLGSICFLKGNAQSEVGVHFEDQVSWDRAMAKAKAEHKYVFVDCFATWCVPCRKMDQEVYVKADVGEFMNKNFVSVRLQMDSTSNDAAATKDNYAVAHKIMKKFNINAFPSFIFLDPDGNIVHRDVGFLKAADFINVANSALDTNVQYYTLLADFKQGRLAYDKMPGLARALDKIGEKVDAAEVAGSYIENYLIKMDKRALFQQENIRFITSHIHSTNGKAFEWLYRNAGEVDSAMEYGRFSEEVVENTIAKCEVNPITKKWDSLGRKDVGKSDWNELQKDIRKRYTDAYAARIILGAQLRWSRAKKDWDKLVYYEVRKINNYGLDTAGTNVVITNNNIFNVIFMHSHSKRIIKRAIGWMRIICNAHPEDEDYQDTYANLVYKLGEKRKAIILEQRAYSFSKEGNKEIKLTLEKMKNGQPTWPLN